MSESNNKAISIATIVTVLFIVISPFENIYRIETIIYVIGIILLSIPKIKTHKIRFNDGFWLLLLSIYIIFTAFWSPNNVSFKSLLVTFVVFLFLFLQLQYDYSIEDLEKIKIAFIIQGVILVVICSIYGNYVDERFWINTDQSGVDPNYLAAWFILPLCACIEKILGETSVKTKVLLIVEVLSFFYYIFITGSRSGLIVNSFLIVLCVIYKLKNTIYKYPIRALFIILFTIMIFWIGFLKLPDVMLNRLSGTKNMGSRGAIWRQLFEAIDKNPIRVIPGFGYAAVQKYNYEHLVAHNTFLDVLFNYGLIGVTIFIGYIIKRLKRIYKSNPYATISGLVMCLSIFTLTALTTRFMMITLFYIGMTINCDFNER